MGKNRILIVEDESVVAMCLKKTLARRGYEVCGTVSSGQEAIEKARSLRPDVILMDILLDDGMSGVQAARIISSESPAAIIYTTGSGDEELLRDAVATGSAAILRKPYGLEELEESIRAALLTPRPEDNAPGRPAAK